MSKKSLFDNNFFRLFLWVLTWIIAYFILQLRFFVPFRHALLSMNYLGTFIAGVLFSYSFSAVPAAALLIILGHDQNIYAAGFVGALGAMCSDIAIFKFSRLFLKKKDFKKADTFGTLPLINRITKFLIKNLSASFKKFIKITVAIIIIASPLPNEIGIAMLGSSLNISLNSFIFISLGLNIIGVFILLGIGKLF